HATEQLHQPEVRYAAGERDAHEQHRAGKAARVQEHENRRDQDRSGEELEDLVEALDQVAHQLGEADDVDSDVIAFEGADLALQGPAEFPVIQAFAGLRVEFAQRDEDHRRSQVVTDEAGHEPGAPDAELLLRHDLGAAAPAGHHRPPRVASLGDFRPAQSRSPQPPPPGPGGPARQVYGGVDLLQRQQVVLVEDI